MVFYYNHSSALLFNDIERVRQNVKRIKLKGNKNSPQETR